jgi:two-component system sensor kinase FixL
MAIKETGDRAPVSVPEMIAESVAIVRRQLADLGAELKVRLTDDLPLVCADHVQLQQVVINLLVNAAQAMAESRSPRRRIDLDCSAADGRIVVVVADTGPGFDDDRASKLFNAFFTTKATGMGIGLSVSKTIVEAHGGTISASSPEGGGACFRFELPVRGESDEPQGLPSVG